MNKYLVLVVFTLCTEFAYSQYLPYWIKMGMSINEIENNLNGQKLEKKNNNLYLYIIISPPIIYQFNVDTKKGLTEYWVISNHFDIEKIVEDYSLVFNDPVINNGFWWFNQRYLPETVIAISVSSKGKAVNICYFFKNSIEDWWHNEKD